MHDVIVYDEEFTGADSAVSKASAEIDTLLKKYLAIMERASAQGLPEGASANALRYYIGRASMLKGFCSELAKQHGAVMKRYLSAVDNTDSYLY